MDRSYMLEAFRPDLGGYKVIASGIGYRALVERARRELALWRVTDFPSRRLVDWDGPRRYEFAYTPWSRRAEFNLRRIARVYREVFHYAADETVTHMAARFKRTEREIFDKLTELGIIAGDFNGTR